jgi:enamine deaminase RidA (YjgF/YER057c/UK114 family)
MEKVEYVTEQIHVFFGDELVPPLSHVEWTSTGLPIEIEMVVASPPTDAENSITVITPKGMTHSPVFSRVIWVQSDTHIFLSSVSDDASDGAVREAESVFKELKMVLKECNSDFRHLVKATYYVSSNAASSALNEIRPTLYDPKRPPAASKAAVRGIGLDVGELSVDLIAVPRK